MASELFNELSEVYPGLWVGSSKTINDTIISDLDIGKIFVANPDHDIQITTATVVDLIETFLEDGVVDISKHFPVAVQAFKECRETNVGLACVCTAGICRSATLALAAMIGVGVPPVDDTPMEVDGDDEDVRMTLRMAYYHVKRHQSIIAPNCTFFEQVIDYEKDVLGKKPSVTMIASHPDFPYDLIPDVYSSTCNV